MTFYNAGGGTSCAKIGIPGGACAIPGDACAIPGGIVLYSEFPVVRSSETMAICVKIWVILAQN